MKQSLKPAAVGLRPRKAGAHRIAMKQSLKPVAVGLRPCKVGANRMALIDSGATNNVRHGTAKEAELAVTVQVTLADGKGELLQLPSGTLLCGSESQVIVSMGLLVLLLRCTVVGRGRAIRDSSPYERQDPGRRAGQHPSDQRSFGPRTYR